MHGLHPKDEGVATEPPIRDMNKDPVVLDAGLDEIVEGAVGMDEEADLAKRTGKDPVRLLELHRRPALRALMEKVEFSHVQAMRSPQWLQNRELARFS